MSQAKSDANLNRLTLAVAVIAGALVRLINISESSIWHDEGYTMMLAPQSPLQILSRTGRDVHPPLYYLTLHFWLKLFGNSEAAARSLSAVFGLITIVAGYFLVRRLFGAATARVAAIFLATGPFLVRYSQEARMYGMVAALITVATLMLVRALDSGRKLDWLLYALFMAAALYTHYYSVFIVPVHWFYVGLKTNWRGFRAIRWWAAQAVIAILFIPWLPVAYRQFSRVQAAFWIPAVSFRTLPNTLAQFLTFTNLERWPLGLKMALIAALIAGVVVVWHQGHQRRANVTLIAALASFGPLAVFALSLKRPIYVDRYFVFAAVGFYLLLAVLIYAVKPWRDFRALRLFSMVVLLAVFGYGIRNVYIQSNHQMRTIGHIVTANYQPGDELVSGELYTFFDFSYYNHTGQPLKLLAPDGVSGYGETSLIYDQPGLVVAEYRHLRPDSGYVWVIGKTGAHDYFEKVPTNWTPVGPHYQAGYSAAQRYSVAP